MVFHLPDQVDGAYCFHAGKTAAMERWAGRPIPDVVNPHVPAGPLAALWDFDAKTRSVREYLDADSAIELGKNATWGWRLGQPLRGDAFGAVNLDFDASGARWRFAAPYDDCLVSLPAIRLAESIPLTDSVRILGRIDGGLLFRQGTIAPPAVIAFESGGAIGRRRITLENGFDIPAGSRVVRIDLSVPIGTTLEIAGYSLELR